MMIYLAIFIAFSIVLIAWYIFPHRAPAASSDPPIRGEAYQLAFQEVEREIAASSRFPEGMRELCEYAIKGGRRVRAVIVLAIAGRDGMPLALAIEQIQAASLIVDDIMDNDAVRRGQPSVAAKFGQNAAQMASVQLVSGAFLDIYSIARRLRAAGDERADRIAVELMGLSAGTLKDLSLGQWQEQSRKVDGLDDVIRLKTGSLFVMSFLGGWIARNGAESSQPRVREVADNFGELFQIVDDLGDQVIDSERGTANYATVHGQAAAMARAESLATLVIAGCQELEIEMAAIADIVEYLVEKAKNNCLNATVAFT